MPMTKEDESSTGEMKSHPGTRGTRRARSRRYEKKFLRTEGGNWGARREIIRREERRGMAALIGHGAQPSTDVR